MGTLGLGPRQYFLEIARLLQCAAKVVNLKVYSQMEVAMEYNPPPPPPRGCLLGECTVLQTTPLPQIKNH